MLSGVAWGTPLAWDTKDRWDTWMFDAWATAVAWDSWAVAISAAVAWIVVSVGDDA